MSNYQPGKMVSLVGRVTSESTIETSDGMSVSITAHSLPGMPETCAAASRPAARAPVDDRRPRARSGCVEVIGQIEDGAAISPKRFCSFGEDFGTRARVPASPARRSGECSFTVPLPRAQTSRTTTTCSGSQTASTRSSSNERPPPSARAK